MAKPDTPSDSRDKLDPIEQEKLVLDYLPLVNYVLGRLGINIPKQIDREDLFSSGVIGLINASRGYDPNRGASFKTYAYTNVKGAILDELRRQDFIPRTQRDRMKVFNEARQNLEIKLGYPPKPDQIAQEMGVPVEEVDEILMIIRTITWLSLDENVGGDYDRDMISKYLANPRAVDPADAFALKEMKELVRDAVMRLGEAERTVILLYYNQDLLLKEIGEVMGISESRVSQIHSRALYHLNQEVEKLERVKPGRL